MRVLETLASASHTYVPEGHNEEDLRDMNEEWHRRFDHLMVKGEGDEECQL